MNIERFALMLLLLLVICPNCFAQKISHEELVEVLGIRSWRVPLPKDEKSGWGIKIISYEPRRPSDTNTEKLDLQNKALIVVRETGKNTYQFILKQRRGTSRGEFEINVCPEKGVAGNRCENSYVITWYDIPMPYGDGLRYVIAEVTAEANKLVKQIILEPSSYRGEDMVKERPTSP